MSLLRSTVSDAEPRSPVLRRPALGARRAPRAGLAAAAALAVLVGGVGTAAATTHNGRYRGFRGPGLTGTLASINGSTLGLKAASGTVQAVTVTAATVYDRTVGAAASAVTNGAQVSVGGTLSGGTMNAARVAIGRAGGAFGPGGAAGTRPGGGYRPAGLPGGTVASGGLPEGGPWSGGEVPSGVPGGRFGTGLSFINGTVSNVTAASFTLTEPDGTKGMVELSSKTTFTDTTRISEAKLVVGQQVVIRGYRTTGTQTLTASNVSEGPVPAWPGL